MVNPLTIRSFVSVMRRPARYPEGVISPTPSRMNDVILSSVQGVNPFEEALERVLYAIQLGIFGHGQRLPPERELSIQLGVSRMTLRSVIRSLQETGYIASKPGRYGGSFVVWEPSGHANIALDAAKRDLLLDAMVFRTVVEPGAVELAARREKSDAEIEELRVRLGEVSAAGPGQYRVADCRFHVTLAALSGSNSLTKAVADIQMSLDDLLRAVPYMDKAIAHAQDQHVQIAEAVIAGDAAQAKEIMTTHIEATATLVRGFMSSVAAKG
jgi:DNA-binding FadR family transcriptional regulator